MLATEVVLCEDGHAQERSLLGQGLPFGRTRRSWLADRQLLHVDFLCALPREVAVLWCASTAS